MEPLAAVSRLVAGFLATLPPRAVFDRVITEFSQSVLTRHDVQAAFVREALMRPAPAIDKHHGSETSAANASTSSPDLLRFPAGGVPQLYPPRFLRIWMDEIEHAQHLVENEMGVEESFMDAMVSFCQGLHNTKLGLTAGRGFQVFFPYADIRNEQSRLIVSSSAVFSEVGFRLWNAGKVLFEAIFPLRPGCVQYSLEGPLRQALRGKRVVEIGAGLGVNAVALRSVGAKKILLTDHDTSVLENLAFNCILNCPEMVRKQELLCSILDVEAMSKEEPRNLAAEYDVVLAADVTYSPELAKSAVQAFAAMLQREDQVGFLVATRRSDEVWSVLGQSFRESRDLVIVDVTDVVKKCSSHCLDYLVHHDMKEEAISIFQLRPCALMNAQAQK